MPSNHRYKSKSFQNPATCVGLLWHITMRHAYGSGRQKPGIDDGLVKLVTPVDDTDKKDIATAPLTFLPKQQWGKQNHTTGSTPIKVGSNAGGIGMKGAECSDSDDGNIKQNNKSLKKVFENVIRNMSIGIYSDEAKKDNVYDASGE